MSEKQMSKGMNFLFGGLAGMAATCVVQPMDLVKTRLQVSQKYKGAADCIFSVIKEEGPLALYKGLSAALFRQATYTTARLGIYAYLIDLYKGMYDNKEPNFGALATMGIAAGAGGALAGTPADVVLVRMTADGQLPAAERRNYKNVFEAFTRIVRQEGFATLFRGCTPTVVRAMVVNMTQLASYTMAKRWLRDMFNLQGLSNHVPASLISGFLTTISSMPVDMAKTQLQNMKTAPGDKPQYKGTMDVIFQIVKRNGPLSLWRGFWPYFARIGPHTVLTFVFLEQFTRLYKKYVLGSAESSQ